MALIPVERAKAGMVLAEAVNDRRGRLLIPAGKELSERYLDSLPMWGVTHVAVQGADSEDSGNLAGELEAWAIAQATEEVDRLFLLANRSHPVVEQLAELCVRRRAAGIQREGSS